MCLLGGASGWRGGGGVTAEPYSLLADKHLVDILATVLTEKQVPDSHARHHFQHLQRLRHRGKTRVLFERGNSCIRDVFGTLLEKRRL